MIPVPPLHNASKSQMEGWIMSIVNTGQWYRLCNSSDVAYSITTGIMIYVGKIHPSQEINLPAGTSLGN
jgi:hypothetical protein